MSSFEVEAVKRKVRGYETCSYCALRHHSTRIHQGEYVCAACDYLELVQAETASLSDAISFLREKELCAYCGEAAQHIEHVVPRRAGLPTFTLPACAECNLIAGGRIFGCFEEKREFIKKKLARRYKKELQIPEWDVEELADLGYNLRVSTIAAQEFKRVVQQRLDWHWLEAILKRTDH